MENYTKIEGILGSFENMAQQILIELRKMYLEFIKKGVFYEIKSVRVIADNNGYRDTYRHRDYLEETAGIEGEPYETIGDWLDEYTGENISWNYRKYYDDVTDTIENFLINKFDENVVDIADFEEEQLMARYEILDYLSELPIDILEKGCVNA